MSACVDRSCAVVVNADDFGASVGINRGIVEAHRCGPVTSASLMVNMPATADAVRRLDDLPRLSVGIHVNLTNEGDPVVPLDDVDACRRELHHQLEVFQSMVGRPPTHLDSHHNVHISQPRLTQLFLEAGKEMSIPVRNFSGIPYISRFYGRWDDETHPEQVTVEMMLEILSCELGRGPIEFACHPGYTDTAFVSEYDTERELELRTLCSREVATGLVGIGVELVAFAELALGGRK